MIASHIHSDNPPLDVWNKFYDSSDNVTEYYNCTNCKINADSNKIFIYECSFVLLKKTVIHIESSMTYLLHSFCFFDSVSSKSSGSAVYFSGNSVVQDSFCSISAKSGSPGIHSYTHLKGNGLNTIVEGCISLSGNENQNMTIYLYGGKTGIDSSNISKNLVSFVSGFDIAESSEYCICISNYSTFDSNYAYNCVCLSIGTRSLIFYCNIVNNSQGKCITFFPFLELKNCTILGDYGKGLPLYGPHSTVQFSQCLSDMRDADVSLAIDGFFGFNTELQNLSYLLAQKCHPTNHALFQKPYSNCLHYRQRKIKIFWPR